MIFTREDILKIQNALIQLGRKDSEFKEANTPLNSDDYIAILQDGINKKVSINNLLSTLGLLKKDDFINVSDRYDEYYIQLSEAITIIANNKRKKGLVITFQDINGRWRIYQFIDEVSNFIKTEYWKDLFDFKYPIVNSILPDEEDLTLTYPNVEGNSFIQLKDKEYNPDNFSGLGHVILRKNLVEVNDPQTGKSRGIINFLYQDMINKENTIYEIKYDFDLNGQTITIPNNSSLELKGGSIINGFIIFNTQGVITLSPNKSFEEQLIAKNCVYNINNVFNLGGKAIQLPEQITLNFNGGNVVNGTLLSNYNSKIINIPKGLDILGRIFNENDQEISIKGDVIHRTTQLLFPIQNLDFTPEHSWIYDNNYINKCVRNAYKVGITQCYVDLTFDFENGEYQMTNRYASLGTEGPSDELFIKLLKMQGIFSSIVGLRFNVSGANDTPNDMPKYKELILQKLNYYKSNGLNFERVYIANERQDMVERVKEFIPYLIDIAQSIRQLGYTPCINPANYYLMTRVDPQLWSYLEPSFNSYPTITYLDDKAQYSKELSNCIKQQLKLWHPIWNGKYSIQTIGICESGTNSKSKALRFPGESTGSILGDNWPYAKQLFYNIWADLIQEYTPKYYGVWYIESFDQENLDALYNIFMYKFK